MKKYTLLGGLLVSAGLILGVSSAEALTISPPAREFTGDPGEVINAQLKIYNETERDLSLNTFMMEFQAGEDESGEPKFIEKDPQDNSPSAVDWIRINKGPIQVNTHEWKVIPFTIEIPQDAEPGGYYPVIFFSEEGKDAGNVSLTHGAGELLLIRVSGEIHQEGNIKDFYVRNFEKDKKAFFKQIPAYFYTRIENKGNVHFKPEGTIKVRSMLGKEVELDLVDTNSGGNVLPQSIRKYDTLWGTEEAVEELKEMGFFARAGYQFKNFRFGRYTAEVTAALPLGEKEMAKVSFWIIPLELLVLVIVGLIVLGVLFRQYNKMIAKSAVKKSSKKK
jgi:hypothetical protein